LNRSQTQACLLRELSLRKILRQPKPNQPLTEQTEQRFICVGMNEFNALKMAYCVGKSRLSAINGVLLESL
jgi:hypothetical protein